jgi:hypothetical protein
MKLSLTLFFIIFLANGAHSRLIGSGRLQKPTIASEKRPARHDAKKPGHYGLDPSSIDSLPEAPEKHVAVTDTDNNRKINKVRVTLTDVNDLESMTPAEIIFFEDCFMYAFIEAQSSGTGDEDVHARSLIVVGESSESKTDSSRGNRDRSLLVWRTPKTYFDIFAIMEWSCYFCGGSRYGDDFYSATTTTTTTTIKKRKVTNPAPRPMRASTYADAFTNDDFEFVGVTNYGEDPSVDDDFTDDNVYFSGRPVDEDEQWGLGDSFDTNEAYSMFFGNRRLSEGDEDRFEDLLCARLRNGPFPAFHPVGKCLAIFTD